MMAAKVFSILAVVSLASGSPHPLSRHFSLSRNVVATDTSDTFPAIYARALQKYHAAIPKALDVAVKKHGSATARSVNDSLYLTNVKIGNQVFALDIDTGSSDLWVYNASVPASSRGGTQTYTPSSSAHLDPNQTWSINYADGSGASGDVYIDKVTLGGIAVTSQAVEVADQVSGMAGSPADGIFGFGFDNHNTVRPTPQKTWFTNAMANLSKPVFCADLNHLAPGAYDFGYINKARYQGSIRYAPVDSTTGYWMFNAQNWAINATKGNFEVTSIVDTGTTLLLMFNTINAAYWSTVKGAHYSLTYSVQVFPCKSVLPDFTLFLHGQNITVPGAYMNFGPTPQNANVCFGGMQSNSDMTFAVLGDVFIKSQYVIFDRSVPQVGFAQKK